MILTFTDELINADMLKTFVDAVNSDAEHINIYIQSDGGSCSVTETMIDIINSDPKRFTLIGSHFVGSSAFILLLKVNCEKYILPNTTGMHHQPNFQIRKNEDGSTTYTGHKVAEKANKKSHKAAQKFNKKIRLTKKQIKKYNKGQDIYIKTKQLLKMINND